MATRPTYCTERDLKDVFPHIDEFDSKTPIYGWVVHSGSLYRADNCGLITLLFADGQDLGNAEANSGVVDVNGEWYYDSALDAVYYYNDATNPNDMIMEAGEDWATLVTRIIKNASRYFESRVDGNIPRDQWKDKEGNFDYMVIRTTSLIAVYFLLNAHNPGNELSLSFMEEINFNIDQINSGNSKLSYQVSSDSSQGMVREVTAPQDDNPIHIVDTRGNYTGIYDLIKIIITQSGAIGTSKFDVYVGGSTGLKANQIVTGELMTGQYQSIGNGLQIRFQGKDDSSIATVSDEWELEVWGVRESMDGSPGSSTNTRMTRRR